MKIGRPGKAIAAILCLAAAALVWRSIALRPRIESLDPPAAAAGTELRIRGGGFGQGGGDSALLVDGAALTAKSIVSWSDTEIVFRMPAIVDSGLVAVRTGAGLSNRELFMNSAKLPVVPERMEAALSGPSIKSIAPAEGEIGTLLRVEGINFGSGGPGSSVIFTSGTPVSPLAFTTADPESVRNAVVIDSGIPGEIETWDDKGISVRIPDGAGSGAVLVRVPAGESGQAFVRITAKRGVKRLSDPESYAVTQRVAVSRIKTGGGNEFDLWLPEPPDTPSQRRIGELDSSRSPDVTGYHGVSLYRYFDLTEASNLEFSRTLIIQIHSVETETTAAASFPLSAADPEFLDAFMRSDSLVPAARKEIKDLAVKIAGKEKDGKRVAVRIWDWLGKNLKWTESRKFADPVAAIRAGSADSKSYALAACALLRAAGLPAVPVAGFLAGRDSTAIPHYWVEYYLPGVGWIPFDAILGSGARPGGFDGALDESQRYHGSLDNRHIAISRGLSDLTPSLPAGRKITGKAAWSFQTLFEESKGLNSYVSEWFAPGISTAY